MRVTTSAITAPTPNAMKKPKKPKPVPLRAASATPIATAVPADAAIARAALAGLSRTSALRGMRAQSRHFTPTGACTMQSVQIGLPHDEHETSVSTVGWLAQRGSRLLLDGGHDPSVNDVQARRRTTKRPDNAP